MEKLQTAIAEHGGFPVLRLTGSLDSRHDTSLAHAFSRVESSGSRRLILDLTDTEYVTAAGWGLILDRHRAWKRTGREFLVSGMNPGVRSLFNFLELRSTLPAAVSLDEAVRILTGGGGPSLRAAA